jgi:hypothetical protein
LTDFAALFSNAAQYVKVTGSLAVAAVAAGLAVADVAPEAVGAAVEAAGVGAGAHPLIKTTSMQIRTSL